jgi:hypothetical protein
LSDRLAPGPRQRRFEDRPVLRFRAAAMPHGTLFSVSTIERSRLRTSKLGKASRPLKRRIHASKSSEERKKPQGLSVPSFGVSNGFCHHQPD